MPGREDVGTARYLTEVDASGVDKGLRDAERKIKQTGKATEDAFARQGTQAVGRFQGALNKLFGTSADFRRQGGIGGAILGGFGLGAGLGAFGMVQNAVGMAIGTINDAIDAASDLAESQSKVGVVFGESARAIEEWSRTSDKAMGLSKRAALEAAGTFGNLFDALGLANDATTEMSKGAVQLAADLASFNNADTEETLLAIRSGLLGEAEPMRKFGASLSEARVQAHALAQGWVRNKNALTDAMKVQARYELILKDTVNAQGDYARTADGAANSARTLAAQQENLNAKLGQLLAGPHKLFLDFMSDVVDAVDGPDGATGALARMRDEVEALGAEMEDAASPAMTFGQFMEDLAKQERYISISRSGSGVYEWIRGYALVGQMLGNSVDQMAQTAEAYKKAGKTIDEFHQDMIDALVTDGPQVIAQRLGIAVDAVNAELETRMASGLDFGQALGQLWVELVEQRFTPASETAAQAMSAAGEKVGEAAGEGIATGLTTSIKALPELTRTLASDFKDLESFVTISMERVRRKSGKGWRWKRDVSTQLSDLRRQFKNDIREINWLLDHGGRGRRTRTELEEQLETLQRKARRAMREKNWVAYERIKQEIAGINDELTELNGRQVTATINMWLDKNNAGGLSKLGTLGRIFGYRAGGGPVAPFGTYLVGEQGPEILTMGAQSGHVTSSEGGRGMASTVRHIHELAPGAAQQLRAAGFDDRRVASFLLASPDQMSRQWDHR